VTFFKKRERRGSARRGSIQPDGSKKSDGVGNIYLFEGNERRGPTRRDSIQPDGSKDQLEIVKLPFSRKGKGGDSLKEMPSNQIDARNQMEMVSSRLSDQKVTFFKERERRGSTRRDSIQPNRSKKSDEDGKPSF
jgi:hypothetical protein